MADDDSNGNRVTIALVGAMVGEVKATVVGGFADVQRQLSRLDKTPETVAVLEETSRDHERRLGAVEQSGRDLLPRVVSVGALLLSAAAFIASLIH